MKTVWYALGGGLGHGRRALNLARSLPGTHHILHQSTPRSTGRITQVPVGSPSIHAFRAQLAEACTGADRLVVDCFPWGIAHELDLPKSVETVLVARYVDRSAYRDYDEGVRRFDTVWLPYDSDDCEWDEPPPGEFIGPVAREVQTDGEAELLVIGHGEPASWTPLLRGSFRVDGPFDALPRARRVLALAAGYNLAWELHRMGRPTAFRPLHRRFDDQFRRARQRGTAIHHRRDLERFLETPWT